MTNALVRKANEGDWECLADLYFSVRKSTMLWLKPEQIRREEFFEYAPEEEQWLAEIDGALAGFISIYAPKSFIHMLFVDKKFQGHGVGSLLVERASKIYPRPMRLKCGTDNKSACAFYEKIGFEIESFTPVDPLGPYNTYILK